MCLARLIGHNFLPARLRSKFDLSRNELKGIRLDWSDLEVKWRVKYIGKIIHISLLAILLAATREYHGTHEYHVSPDSRCLLDHSGSGKVQPSPLPSEPFGVSARGLSQPKFCQPNEDGAGLRYA